MNEYILYYKDTPLGKLTFNIQSGVGNFTYSYTSETAQNIPIKPETVITILEEIRYDASGFKMFSEVKRYVRSSFGKFYFKEVV